MFEELHLCSWVVARHLNEPFVAERARYPTYCAERGDSKLTLTTKANIWIHVARKLSLCRDVNAAVKRLCAGVEGRGDRDSAWTRKLVRRWGWLDRIHDRYASVAPLLGWWHEPIVVVPFEEHLDEYCLWMREVRGLTEQTCNAQRQYAVQFLRWYANKRRPLIDLCPRDVDRYLAEGGATRWCRISVRDVATALRGFFRFGGTQDWSRDLWPTPFGHRASTPTRSCRRDRCGPQKFDLRTCGQSPLARKGLRTPARRRTKLPANPGI